MRDMFDEFMEELRRRQAAQAGGDSADADAPKKPEAPDAEKTDATQGDTPREPTPPGSAEDEAASESAQPAAAGEDEPEPGELPEEEPVIRLGGPGWAGRGRGGRGGRGGGRGGSAPGGPRDGAGIRLGRGAWLLIALGILLFVGIPLIGIGLNLWTDAIWYGTVGFSSVFWTRLGTQVVLFVVTFVVALAILLFNLIISSRFEPAEGSGPGLRGLFERLGEATTAGGRPGGDRYRDDSPFGPRGFGRGMPPGRVVFDAGELPEIPDLTPLATWGLAAIAILLSLGLAAGVAGNWEQIQLWLHQVPFSATGKSVTDPVFGRDISFFLFQLPFLRLIQSFANWIILGSLVIAFARYLVGALRGGLAFPTSVRVHLAVLGGLYLLSVAAGYQLDKFELVYSTQGGSFVGVSYTDHAARFLALDVMTVIAAFAAAFLIGGAFTRMTWPLGLAVIAWFAASVVLGQVYPGLVQRFTVEPNQFAQEQPYIQNNIAMTRLAFGLDRTPEGLGQWTELQYAGTGDLTPSAIQQDAATFQNARLWDYRPLGATLDQLQTVRQYYDFVDVDTDRYVINGQLRQVMLSGRELAPDKLASTVGGGQLSWVNEHITYTHGIGLAMVPVNEVTPEGQPQLIIRDLPPVSTGGAPKVTEPRIYFGTRDADYVITGTTQPEFDYPQGGAQPAGGGTETGAQTSWQAKTGIPLDSTLARLLFAGRLGDLNLLISDQFTSGSQLLIHRTLSDRLNLIAPFLSYDKDPYLVVTGSGRLAWVQDAYTTSSYFPNAQPFDGNTLASTGTSGLANQTFDYIRNSVKVVMDAYDGTMSFYVSDPNDPIIRAYEGVFPSLFKPLSALPSDLAPHLRFPEEYFNVQARTWASYHVTNAQTFYRGDDKWTVPSNPLPGSSSLPFEAYYVVMRMPGEANPEFLLLQPMVPQNRPNMIAWVAARNDGQGYGQVRVYEFPRDTTILGPGQIEARIDQDPVISSQFTLWGQAGSNVIRGNLIVVPVQDALLYLEPIYLQATSGSFPEFKKIVVASPSKVVWGDTLAGALNTLLAGGPTGPTTSPSPSPGGPSPSPSASPTTGPSGPPPAGVAGLIADANSHFEAAQQALRSGDFARYGQEIAIVQNDLRQLQLLTGASPAPASPAPGGSAALPMPTPVPTP